MTPPQAATQATSPISQASSTEAKSSWKMKKIDGREREDADEQVELAAADGDVQCLCGYGEGVDVQDVGRDRAVQHHEQHRQGQGTEVWHDELAGVNFTGVGGQAGAQDAQPDDRDELAQHRAR